MKVLNESNFAQALREMKQIAKARNTPFALGLRPRSLVTVGKLTNEEKEALIEISRLEKNKQ
ncbi:hypothetical protein K6754_07640 [Vibrio alginolyticus]|uniref:hypothetical protein n=1 Tax=Vibrio alginolyticus TaxID=663 RepID=UPI001EF0E33A|nr:hypothetical protein [Vibrio alginolyticus]ULF92984.1 hypothetical protein K6754_07640 [Vibrio alginolyticus]